MKEDTDKLEERVKLLEEGKPKHYFEDVEENYMAKKDHETLCKINKLEFATALKDAIIELKDQLMPELRRIHETIKAIDRNNP